MGTDAGANNVTQLPVQDPDCRAPKPNWKNHPITPALLVALVMGAVTLAGWSLGMQAWVDSMAKDQAAAAVTAHQAPDVAKVHDISKLMPASDHARDVAQVRALISEQGHRIDRTLDRLDSKLDALVTQDRAGRYTRRGR